MKSQELTLKEAEIPISLNDIKKIKKDSSTILPFNKEAINALKTGLSIRDRRMNIFVCGNGSEERKNLIKSCIKHLNRGEICNIVAKKNKTGNGYPVTLEKTKNIKTNNQERLLVKETKNAPIFFENNPTEESLFGKESKSLDEIVSGNLLKSNGGLIILNAADLIEEKDSWKHLKRTLKSSMLLLGTDACFVSPIEVDLKVILEGTEEQYEYFFENDEVFREFFQIYSEIDSVISLNTENLKNLVNLLRNFSEDRLNFKLDDSAAFELIKYSIASAESKKKLSSMFSELELFILEAAENAKATEKNIITENDIKNVISNQAARYSLFEQSLIEEMKSGEINIHIEGSEIGKVNGLAIIEKGPWAFGFPGLISATIAPGENGLVNIEHEAGLSGEIHDKWVLILEAFLRSRFAGGFPISIFASICFEQSYSEVDGDSASSSELYALLSAIAKIPIRQDIAVTGSLSQTGEILTVGGLREKIEGFYKICKAINFTGHQGVIVPEKNIDSIILPDDILKDIKDKKFHIYTVSTVNQSMEILTGKKAGERNAQGKFPSGSLNYIIEKNLKAIAALAKNSS